MYDSPNADEPLAFSIGELTAVAVSASDPQSLLDDALATCPCCSTDRVVAPFVEWLRDGPRVSLEMRLLGQALAVTAVEQLDGPDLARAEWPRLDVTRLLNDCRHHCWPTPSRRDMRRGARYLVDFLHGRGLLRKPQAQRLAREIRTARIATVDDGDDDR